MKWDPLLFAVLILLAYVAGAFWQLPLPRNSRQKTGPSDQIDRTGSFQINLTTSTTERKDGKSSMGIWETLNTNSGAVQAIAACVIVLLTGVLAALTWWYAGLTRELVRLGTEPAVDVTIGPGMNDNKLLIVNGGVDKILDVRVDVDDYHFATAKNRATRVSRSNTPAKYSTREIKPGGTFAIDLREHAEHVIRNSRGLTTLPIAGPEDQSEPLALDSYTFFRITFRREVDRRRYLRTKRALVSANAGPVNAHAAYLMDLDGFGMFLPDRVLEQLKRIETARSEFPAM